ncbi:MAG TPA: fumarylacetoacetate hydrolase family protein [Sphingomicrobium sp.]|nr:fumarylacetoacetate hydrolase family protein [Sphingomicrobium sp.]
MKLARVEFQGTARWAAIADGGAFDLTPLLGIAADGVHRLFEDGGMRRAEEHVAGRSPDMSLDALTFAPLLPAPEKIICVGVNYHNRNEEYRDGSELPKFPSLFMRAPTSFTAHERPLVRPRESEQLDYEGEIAIVIGRGGRRVARDRATAHIAGLTLMNEGTIRDWVRHAKFNVTQGKNFDRTGSIGPWMVTSDEIGDFGALALQTRVNGELRQDDTTANLIFSFADLIAYISSFTTLKPGDIISTGTPPGAGARADPPVYLKPGDVIEISSPAIGMLRNGVTDG